MLENHQNSKHHIVHLLGRLSICNPLQWKPNENPVTMAALNGIGAHASVGITVSNTGREGDGF
jgi:hypothetical protein